MDNSVESKRKSFLWECGIVTSFLIGSVAGYFTHTYNSNTIPTTSNVEKGYADPSKLEVTVEDLNFDRKPKETAMWYDGNLVGAIKAEQKSAIDANNKPISKTQITIIPIKMTEEGSYLR